MYGYLLELTYRVKSSNKNRRGSKLWYLDVSEGPGCPRVVEVQNFPFQGNAFNPSLYPPNVPADLAFLSKSRVLKKKKKMVNLPEYGASEFMIMFQCTNNRNWNTRASVMFLKRRTKEMTVAVPAPTDLDRMDQRAMNANHLSWVSR